MYPTGKQGEAFGGAKIDTPSLSPGDPVRREGTVARPEPAKKNQLQVRSKKKKPSRDGGMVLGRDAVT